MNVGKWDIERTSAIRKIRLTPMVTRKGAMEKSLRMEMRMVKIHQMGLETLITPNPQPMQIIRHQMGTM